MAIERWTLELEIASVAFRIVVSGASPDRARIRFGSFARALSVSDPVVTLEVHVDRGYATELPQPAVAPFPACVGVRDGTSFVFRRSGFEMIWDASRRRAICRAGGAGLHRDDDLDVSPIDTPMRILLATILPTIGGALVHACGYGDSRGAVLFAGESGAGKTTTARKLPHENVLSDDLVVVRRVNDQWLADGTPFVGEYGRATQPRSAPLRRVFILSKSRGQAVPTKASGIQGVRSLIGCLPWFAVGDPSSAKLLEYASDISERGLIWNLALSRDAAVAGVIDGALR